MSPVCEVCWREAQQRHADSHRTVTDHYNDLIDEYRERGGHADAHKVTVQPAHHLNREKTDG